MAIVPTSKALCSEFTEELYRKRVLTVCFNDQERRKVQGTTGTFHDQGHGISTNNDTATRFYTTVPGICSETDLNHVDFSR